MDEKKQDQCEQATDTEFPAITGHTISPSSNRANCPQNRLEKALRETTDRKDRENRMIDQLLGATGRWEKRVGAQEKIINKLKSQVVGLKTEIELLKKAGRSGERPRRIGQNGA